MLRVTIELWPGGLEEYRQEIGRMDIYNDVMRFHPAHPRRGNYGVRLWRKGFRSVRREGEVNDWPRLSKDVWLLVKQAIDSVL